MSKSLKSAAKTKSANDLFGAEPKGRAAPEGRVAGGQRRGRLYRGRHRGAGRTGAGTPPPRHVYRRHRRKGAASSVRRSHRQRHGRGAGRACLLHRGRTGRRRISDRHRQRPRHPGRSASEISEEVRARSHHVHAAFRRQVRLQGLRDLGRPARRRRLRGQRPLLAARGRGRARAEALQDVVSSAVIPRASSRISARSTTAAAPGFASSPTPIFSAPRPRSSRSGCSRWRARRPICLAA